MARKNLLAGLTNDELPAGNSPDAEAAAPAVSPPPAPHLGVMGTRGAIGAVTRSIEQLKAQSVVELSPELIDASFITDRLESSPGQIEELVASIREHGQQVPVLVRPHPEIQGRFQIAYGRRRLKAVTALGRPVRAVIKPLTDEQLVVAQGQENSARTDLSFIEKALFAAKLKEGGFQRETIMAALSVDKTGLSRLISAAVKIPRDLVEAIGPSPKAGRDRWSELALRLESPAAIARARAVAESERFASLSSDERFSRIFAAVAPKKRKATRASVWKAEDGTRVARIREEQDTFALIVDKRAMDGFSDFLVASLEEVYAAFKRRAAEMKPEHEERSTSAKEKAPETFPSGSPLISAHNG